MVANIQGLAGVTKRNRPSCEFFYACESNYLYWHMDLPDTDVEWIYPVEKVFVPGGKPEGRYMGGGGGGGFLFEICQPCNRLFIRTRTSRGLDEETLR